MNEIEGYRFGKYFLNVKKLRLYDESNNQSIKLRDKSLEVLTNLVKAQTPLSVEELVSDPTIDFDTYNSITKNAKDKVYSAIHELRKILGDAAIIKKDDGYAFNYPVQIVLEGDSPSTPPPPPVGGDSKTNWKKAFYLTLAAALLLLIIIGVLALKGKKNVDLTILTIDEAKVHLDMTGNDWNNVSDAEEKNIPVSRAVLYYNYKVRKHFDIDSFAQRVGTRALVEPKWESDDNHPPEQPEDVLDNAKKCSAEIRFARMLYFDISKEKPGGEAFDLPIKIDYFNGHNRLKEEFQSFFIHRPIINLEFKISFPKKMDYPKEVRLIKQKNCYDKGERQDIGILELENPYDERNTRDLVQYVIKNEAERTVTWSIKNPTVTYIYKIEWDWQSLPPAAPK